MYSYYTRISKLKYLKINSENLITSGRLSLSTYFSKISINSEFPVFANASPAYFFI